MTKSAITFVWTAGCLALIVPALAQPPQPPAASAATQAAEIYHVHVAKAAAGKLPELIEAYKVGPGVAAGDPQVAPIILRHREGGEWDIVVITPLGRDHALSTEAPAQPVQAFTQRVVPITDWHADTFTLGPPWDTVQKALVPAAAAQQGAVYTVSDYRSLPGHRQQMRQALDRFAELTLGRSVLFVHVEGAPWNILVVTRYDSWSDVGRQTQNPQAGAELALELREHTAVHHDTVAVYVSGGQALKTGMD